MRFTEDGLTEYLGDINYFLEQTTLIISVSLSWKVRSQMQIQAQIQAQVQMVAIIKKKTTR
ncbi:MAG: hypothetical protein R2728_12645 [Chitinophagales bacterium]